MVVFPHGRVLDGAFRDVGEIGGVPLAYRGVGVTYLGEVVVGVGEVAFHVVEY